MLLDGVVNNIRHIFVNIISAGLFNEVMHNFFCLFVVTVSGEKNAKGSAIYVVAISGEGFLPEVNGGVDVLAPEFRNVSVVFCFGFENVQLMLKKIAIGLSDVFFALELLILFQK